LSNKDALVVHLTKASRVLLFTGAGISTASGIPDYRGPQGVWKTRQPVFYQEFMSSEEDRLRYWQQKSEDWGAFGSAEPNAVHRAVAQLERAEKLNCCVTQNIDGLHGAAGLSPERLVEIHGTNAEVECQSCGDRAPAAPFYEAFAVDPVAPLCSCGGFYKPATISFGQSLRPESMERIQETVMHTDLVIALGTSLSVQPAASITLMAARAGVPYVVINEGPTEHDGLPLVSLRLEGKVEEIFPSAVDAACAMFG
jgi:NAD-dependent deacetylase